MLPFLALFASTASAAPPPATTVCAGNTCDYDDLQAAIDAEPAHIALGPGEWKGPFVMSTVIGFRPLDPSDPPELTCTETGGSTVTLLPLTTLDKPDAPRQTTIARFEIEACPSGRALTLSGNATRPDLATEAWLFDSTLTGGDSPDVGPADGGLVHVGKNARLRVENSTFTERTATSRGGHLFVDEGGSLTLIRGSLTDGTSSRGGAIFASLRSHIAISSSELSNNTALGSNRGGALHLGAPSTFYLSDSVLEGNSAYDGGALSLESNSIAIEALIEGTSFRNNTATNGGAMMLNTTELTVVDTDFINNRADYQGGSSGVGGAIYVSNSDLRLRGVLAEGNDARQGGAIRSSGQLTGGLVEVYGSRFLENRADLGGGAPGGAIAVDNLSADWPVAIFGSTFTENVSTDSGGVLWAKNAGIEVGWSTFFNNQGRIGGVWAGSTNPSNVQQNNVYCQNSAFGGGGGVGYSIDGSAITLSHNIAAGNTASTEGGAYFIKQSGDAYIANHHFLANGLPTDTSRGAAVLFFDSFGAAPNNLFQGGRGNEGMYSTGGGYVLSGKQLLWHAPYTPTFTAPAVSMDGGQVRRYDPDPEGFWESGSCTREVWSAKDNPVYKDGDNPDASADPWPIGAFHDTIFVGSSVDLDGDGYTAEQDCDDWNPEVHPDATEGACDGVDQDCKDPCTTGGETCGPGELRDGATAWFRDLDGDGLGDLATEVLACDHPGALPGTLDPSEHWYVNTPGDCNDNDADLTEERAFWPDDDGDGAGAATDPNGVPVEGIFACEPPPGFVGNNLDCDDTNIDVAPDAAEQCDGLDNDCDGTIDLDPVADGVPLIADNDGDGYGASDALETIGCIDAPGFTAADKDGDCDDDDDSRAPNVEEVCDGVDQNCNLVPDSLEAVDRKTFYSDADNDGFGDDNISSLACEPKPGEVELGGDCNDALDEVFPGAVETCNQRDDDCDSTEDEDAVDMVDGHADSDGDSYGAFLTEQFCAYRTDFVSNNTDCDDSNEMVHPGTSELCNGADDDCDERIDEDPVDGETYFRDEDSDGYGQDGQRTDACSTPEGHSATPGDCNDADAGVHPNAFEDCSPVDRDCSGDATDGAVDATQWFEDADGDGFGNPSADTRACTQPPGFVAQGTDCNDANPGIYPSAPGYDADCAAISGRDVVLVSGGSCSTAGSLPVGWLLLLTLAVPVRRRVSA